jgi:D-psicose/D-tagatose/L-ribulose 3-epimerase
MMASNSNFEGDPAHHRRVAQVLRDNGLQSTAVTVIPDREHSPTGPLPRIARRR